MFYFNSTLLFYTGMPNSNFQDSDNLQEYTLLSTLSTYSDELNPQDEKLTR